MNKLYVASLSIFFALSMQGWAQNNSTVKKSKQTNLDSAVRCYSDEYNTIIRNEHPNMMGSKSFENDLKQTLEGIKSQRSNETMDDVIVIPVVVHVLHNGEVIGVGPNITEAQVLSQITVLNEDYRRMMGTPGYNTNEDGADVEVEFVLAQQTPEGCPTNGIDRVNICMDGVGYSEMQSQKTQTYWDPANYLNMWSAKFIDDLEGILGYAQFPGGTASTDGVASNYITFGSSDYDDGTFSLSAPYDKGRTMTHEVGHFLGLYHTFQGGCDDEDYCDDTPAVEEANYGCPTSNLSCGTYDMVENFMDYTNDECMNVFTNDQKARILAVLSTSTNRDSLEDSFALNAPTEVTSDPAVAIEELQIGCGTSITPVVTLSNWGTQPLTAVTFQYDIDSGTPITYNWSGTLDAQSSVQVVLEAMETTAGDHTFNVSLANSLNARTCNDGDSTCFSVNDALQIAASQINLTLTLDIYGSETTWSLQDSEGNMLYSGGPYTDGNLGTVFSEIFNLSGEDCYLFTINDTYGDGICCDLGKGSYQLADGEGNILVEGGEFQNAESVTIHYATLGTEDYFMDADLKVYPNPATDILKVKMSNNNLPDSYEIYNALGQKINGREISLDEDLNINVSSCARGLYFLKLNKGNETIYVQFLKN
ncbi:M43 family zinc metalloprotease [Mangrovimonas xylaniphaga]|uniref:M43 family zinc metalloprotease n=1 Tax=Mangrovimonas xylaniphaga TaxID=1645915 RepID=UPI0006B560F1|nr:M43 family zinc metalloprotease [Mangrovimonas xylaniphaga]